MKERSVIVITVMIERRIMAIRGFISRLVINTMGLFARCVEIVKTNSYSEDRIINGHNYC